MKRHRSREKEKSNRKRNALRQLTATACLIGLCCFGCAGQAQNSPGQATTEQPPVYVFYDSGITVWSWDNQYGAINEAGELILPLSDRQLEVIADSDSGQQLWIQARTITIDEPGWTAEQLCQTEDGWQHVIDQYQLYDLQGTLVEDLGNRAVLKVYGDLVHYTDGTIVDRQTGKIYFDDVQTMERAGDYFVLSCSDYNSFRIVDQDMKVLQEYEGTAYVKGDRLLVWRPGGQQGVMALDGTEIVPCNYSFINFSSEDGLIIARQDNQYQVLSIEDGAVRFTAPEGLEIFYADANVVHLRSTDWTTYTNRCQMYDYDGNAISDVYSYIGSQRENGIYEPGQDYIFSADTFDDREVLLNQRGEVLYESQYGQWLSPVALDRLILSENSGGSADLIDLDGNVLQEKQYTSIYPVYLYSQDSGYNEKGPMVISYYSYHNVVLCDLLDLDGNIVIERAKNINALSRDRFWVEKGFDQGLMDENGNWLYRQSLFDGLEDE